MQENATNLNPQQKQIFNLANARNVWSSIRQDIIHTYSIKQWSINYNYDCIY